MNEYSSPFEFVVIAALGVAFAVGGVVWAGAALAALLSGHGALSAGLADAVATLPRFPGHASAPAQAWPPPARPQLPSAPIYWACTLACAAVAMAGRWWLSRRRSGPLPDRRFGVDVQARLAAPRDLAPLIVKGPARGRFILGRVGRHLLATEDRANAPSPTRRGRARQGDRGAVALIGPSRSGKTSAAIAGILDWDGPAVLASVKTDLLGATLPWRSRLGDVHVFDPTGSTGHASAGWSPLRDAATIPGAQRAARVLAEAAPSDSVEDGDFWISQCEILLFALLWIAARNDDTTMRDVVDWVLTQDRPTDTSRGEVEPRLQLLLADRDPAVAAAADDAAKALLGIWQMDERTRSSVYATAQTVVWPWADPGVAASARRCDIDLAWLHRGANTLYVCAPIDDQRRLAPVFGGLLNDIVRQAFDHANRTGRPLDPPLLLVIDEAGNTPLRSLPEYASTVAGIGILLVTIWQSKAQLDTTYGRAADTILTNHLTKVFYASASDLAGLDLAGRLLGDTHAPALSLTSGERPGSRSVSESTVPLPLAPPHVLRQMLPGDALLIHGTLPPAHLRTRPYYTDPRLAARANPNATNPRRRHDPKKL